MTMLPDIDEQSWDEYDRQRLAQELDQKQQQFTLQQALNDKISSATATLEPPPPPDLSRIGSWASEPPPTLPPEAATQPAAPVEMPSPPPEVLDRGQNVAQMPSAPQDVLDRGAQASPGDWMADAFGASLNAVHQAGGDVNAFAQSFGPGGSSDAGEFMGNALNAAKSAGADVNQFASNLQLPQMPTPDSAPSLTFLGAAAPGAPSGAANVGGVPDWLTTLIAKNAPELANDPDFIRTVAAGAKAESGWDPNRVQNGFQLGSGGGARGLFQFDMGGMGAPYRGNEQALLGQSGAELQASQIVPLYAKAYQSAPQGLSGAEKASWVAAQAERPYDFTNPNSSARRNYAAAYGELSGQGSAAGASTQELLGRVGGWAQPAKQVSQFGDPQLSADEAYAACGPAAAVRFAQMYGRNPSLREATDLAKTVGWNTASGMAGIASEKALMDKLGIPTKLVGTDVDAMAREASTGNPITISTPGHYFFADNYDPKTGAFHVGQSGLDLRGGSEWMTPAQMEARMGRIQGALFADNPQVPADSTSNLTFGAMIPGDQSDWAGTATSNPVGDFFSGLGSTAQDVLQPPSRRGTYTPAVPADMLEQPAAAAAPPAAEEPSSPIDRLKSAFSDFVDSIGGAKDQAVQNLTGTNPDQADIEQRYQQAQAAAQNLTGSAASIPQSPLDLLGGTSPYGVGTAGEQLTEERNRAIEEANPARDVPGTTGIAQAVLDPTNLLLAGEPGIARVGAQAVGGAADRAIAGQVARQATGAAGDIERAAAAQAPEVIEQAAQAAPTTTRMFHGTGSDFTSPDVAKADPNALFGPGYYLTSDPRVASSYAEGGPLPGAGNRVQGSIRKLQNDLGQAQQTLADTRYPEDVRQLAAERVASIQEQIAQLERAGPNVRAINMPDDLKLLDADNPVPVDDLQRIQDAVKAETARRYPQADLEGPMASTMIPDLPLLQPDGKGVYESLIRRGWEKEDINKLLADAGFDGVKYEGGKRIPIQDADGNSITHDAVAIFPQALERLQNATSLRQGGSIEAALAARLGGATAGGVAGWQSTPEDASLQERLGRTALGAGAGLALAEGGIRGGRAAFRAPTAATPSTGNAVRDATITMHRAQDLQPSIASQVAERVANTIGLGGRTGTLDTAGADKFALINQISGRAKEALGSAFTPEMDAEALLATYGGRGARAKLKVDQEITPALRVAREALGQQKADEYLNEYRKYQRDLEVANRYGGTRQASGGVRSAADAQAALDSLEREVGPTGWAALQKSDQMLNNATAKLLQERVDAGMIEPDLAKRLLAEQPHYNPTVVMKYLDELGAGVSGGGNRLVNTTNLLKRLAEEGSVDDTEQPLRSLVRHFMQTDVLNNRNGVTRAILDAAMADPTLVDAAGKPLVKKFNPMRPATGPEIAGPGGPSKGAPGDIATILQRRFGDQPGLVSTYEDGKRVYYQVPTELERIMKNMDGVDPGALGKVFQALNAPLRWGATAASPPFLARNALRDAITTYVREGSTTARNIPRGMLSAAKQDDLWRQYIQAGGGMESLYQRSPQDIDKLIADTGGLVLRDKSDLARLAKDAVTLQWIRRAGEVIEQGPHIAAFEQHLKAGESPAQAAMAGRRATVDFGRSGDVLQQLNLASLFLNARVQGGLNLGRSLRDDPMAKYRLAGVAATAAAAALHNQQDPAYYDIPEYERSQNGIVMLPGSVKNDNGIGYKQINRISIPLGEISALTDPVSWLASHGDPDQSHWDPRSPQDVGLDVLSTLSPLSGNDPQAAAGSLIPAPLRTPSELAANRRFYTGLPIVPEAYKDLPPSAQANDRTSLLARRLGEAFGKSPMQIDFLINENLGTLGRYGLGVADAAMGKGGETEPLDRAGAVGQAVIGGLASGVVRNYGGQMAADKYDRLDQLMEQFQEPVVAKTVRQLPEYAEATDDRKLSMMRTAQLHLRDTLRDQVGIPNSSADTGLPQKYPGVTDAEEQARIDRAVARWNAYKADPAHAPLPTNEEVQLANLYGGIVSPVYRAAGQIQEQENRALNRLIEQQLATAQGR